MSIRLPPVADRPSASIPILLLTGPVGVGKSTVAGEAARLLREARIAHALVDLAHIGVCFPAPTNDPWHERLAHRNLACMWSNFQKAGALRLLLCRVLEARSLLRHVVRAVPGAEITVIRLRTPLPVLHERLRAREAGRDPQWYLDAATYLTEKMDRFPVEDYLIDNLDRPADDVAGEALRLAGWLASANPRRSPV